MIIFIKDVIIKLYIVVGFIHLDWAVVHQLGQVVCPTHPLFIKSRRLCGIVVVTLSFNAKMVLANFEYNLMTRDSQKWPRKGDLSLWECRGSEPEKR